MKSSIGQLTLGAMLFSAALSGASTGLAQEAPLRGDAAKGAQIAAGVCAACHGADGNSPLAANPRLAGQHPEYLVRQLQDLVKPESDPNARVNPIMLGFASSLSPQDRLDVAAHFAAQKPQPGAARNRDTLALGQKIYRAGLPGKSVPACAGCHSPTGAGIPIQYPRLSGQWAEYSESQLKAFRAGTRRNSVPMVQIAARLSDAEMAAVADYMAGLH